jgi:glycerophosphoryl diester phosphodiesterase
MKYLVLILFVASCAELPDINIPDHGEDSRLRNTTDLTTAMTDNLEGIYRVAQDRNDFGEYVVLKHTTSKHLSIFSGKNTAFMALESGYSDSAIFIEGYWRYAAESATGLISLSIDKNEGAAELISGNNPGNIIIRGLYGDGADTDKTLTLEYDRPLLDANDFLIIAHRGGGRNIDRLGASENSLEMIRMAEILGANGIEIDIQLTSDGVPILFHDEYLSQRLINEKYFVGRVSDYDYKQLRSFCTLKYGEKIPNLDEALSTVLDETELRFVWLDIKSKDMIKTVAPIQKKYMEKARAAGRDLRIVLGLPTKTLVDDYMSFPDRQEYPTLCELSVRHTLDIGAEIWAPRWSAGFTESDIELMHENGIKVCIWTLDEKDFVKSFMEDYDLDGILSNYPSLISYVYNIRN